MPIDPLTGSLLLGTAFNVYGGYQARKDNEKNLQAQEQLNAQTIQFNWDMYNQQRKDALSDRDWLAQFNSPEQQMARLRQAGLNPNLVYGKGAEFTAPQIRAAQQGSVNLKAPVSNNARSADYLMGIKDNIMSALQSKQIQAQTDNLHEQNRLLLKEGVLKDAQTAKLAIETAKTKFDYEQAVALKDLTIEAAKQNVINTIASTNNLNASTNRINQLTPWEVEKLKVEIDNIQSNVARTKWEQRKIETEIQGMIQNQTIQEYISPMQREYLLEQINQLRNANNMNPLNERMLMLKLQEQSTQNEIKDIEKQIDQLDLYQQQFDKGTKAALLIRRLLELFK